MPDSTTGGAPEPRARAGAVMRRYVRGGLALAASVATVISGCGSGAHALNTIVVERAIARSILTQHGLTATVRCPAQVPRRAGFVFTCQANLDVGTYPVGVRETNGGGRLAYQSAAPLVVLNIARVEQAIGRSILSQRHASSTVRCPTEVLQQAGVAFTCTAIIGGRRHTFAVTEVDANGRVRYVGER